MRYVPGFLLALSIISFATLITFGQRDEINKFEVSGGYSWLSLDTGLNDVDPALDNRLNSHGFELSATGNPHHYFGFKGDFSYHTKSESFMDLNDSIHIKFTTSQYLGGVQFKDNRVEGHRFRPFAHVLAGVAHQKLSADGVSGIPPMPFDESVSANSFAMAFGAGVDMNVSRHVSIRLFQADYNPIFFRDQHIGTDTIRGKTQNNFRLGFGVVFH